jgi:hypothetical protein
MKIRQRDVAVLCNKMMIKISNRLFKIFIVDEIGELGLVCKIMCQKIILSILLFTSSSCSFLFGFEPSLESKKRFAFEVGYAGLWRSPLKEMVFLLEGEYGPAIFHKINFDYSQGVRALLEFNQGPKNSIEAVYTGLFKWSNKDSAINAGSNFYVSMLPYYSKDWTNFNYFQYHYKSEFNSGELSYWRHVTPRYVDYFSFSWLLGLRYIDFRDSMSILNEKELAVNAAQVKAVNQMYGAQAGLDFQCNPSRKMTWALQVKGGAYADFVSRKTVFYDEGNTVLLVNSKLHRVKKDYSLELIPYIMYRLNPFYFRLAYDRVILFNPVFAPLQIKPSKFVDKIYIHNYVNFQAVYASIGFYW